MQVLFIFCTYFGMMCCSVLSILPMTKNYFTPVRKLNKVQHEDNFVSETDDLQNTNTEWKLDYMKQDNQLHMSDSKQMDVKESIQKLFRNHQSPLKLSFRHQKTPEKHANNYRNNMAERGFEVLSGGVLNNNNNTNSRLEPKSAFGRPLNPQNYVHSSELTFHSNDYDNVGYNEIRDRSAPTYLIKYTRYEKERPFQARTMYLIAQEYPISKPQSSNRDLYRLSPAPRSEYSSGMPPPLLPQPTYSSKGAYEMPLPAPPKPEKPCKNEIGMTPVRKPEYSSEGPYKMSPPPPPKLAYPSKYENEMSPPPKPAYSSKYVNEMSPPPKPAYSSKYENEMSPPPKPAYSSKYENEMSPPPKPAYSSKYVNEMSLPPKPAYSSKYENEMSPPPKPAYSSKYVNKMSPPPTPEYSNTETTGLSPAPKPVGGAYGMSSSSLPKPAYPNAGTTEMSPAPKPVGGAYGMPSPSLPKPAYPNTRTTGMSPAPKPVGGAYGMPSPSLPKPEYPSTGTTGMSPAPKPVGGAYGMPSPPLPKPEYPNKGATEMSLPPQTEYPSEGGYGMPSPMNTAYGNNMALSGDDSLQNSFMDVKGKTSNFGYEVDNKVNDFHSHRQTDDGLAATGSYSWKDEMGDLITVDYVADHVTGYRATVRNAKGGTQWGFAKEDNEDDNSGDENPSSPQDGYRNPPPNLPKPQYPSETSRIEVANLRF